MKRNQIYSFEALHDVMAVYDREFGISFPRIRPKLESWDLRKSHDKNTRAWHHFCEVTNIQMVIGVTSLLIVIILL